MLTNLEILIVDDEALSCARIRRMLGAQPGIGGIRVAHHGQQALNMIHDSMPDVLFLDIEMPGLDGFAMLNEIAEERRPCIVFVTAYEEHATRAFDVSAVDYLLKPFSRARLQLAMDKVRKEVAARRPLSVAPSYPDRLAIRNEGEVQFIRTSDIDWIEADGRYAVLHSGKRRVLMRESITDLSQRLNPRKFARIHRSFIVNVDRILKMQSLFHGDYRVILHDGTALPLSRSYGAALRELLGLE